jgi:hypothetical protein
MLTVALKESGGYDRLVISTEVAASGTIALAAYAVG